MVLSLWRYAHLALAIISSIFLIILSLTGVVLSINAIYEKTPDLKVENFDQVNLAQVIPKLQEVYPEIISLSVDHRGFVSIDAINDEGENVKGFIDPNSGQKLTEITQQSSFIQWTTALHRSLFLKETGRWIVAIVSFLLILISISGIALILKRQKGIRHFFDKIQKDFFAQYFHVVTGRWMLIPILLIAFTGTFLFLLRLSAFQGEEQEVDVKLSETTDENSIPVADFPVFKTTLLKDVEQIDFPFIPDDPEEFFIVKLKDQSISVNQINGSLAAQTMFAKQKGWERWNLDMHTGRTNMLWALILGIASINILAFIYTGFVITIKRAKTKIKNKFKAEQGRIIILYGSENGSTLFYANKVHQQLLAAGEKSYLTSMNQYELFPQATQLLVFTSTYGLGDPPSNGTKFSHLLNQFPQQQHIDYSVIGFGSTAYPDFCAFAMQVDESLAKQQWASQYLPIHLVNDRSMDDFLNWVNAYSEKSLLPVATVASVYAEKQKKLQKWTVVEKTTVTDDNSTFRVTLKPLSRVSFNSGDLLAIYPANDQRERLYSIGKNNGLLQLIVKKHEFGLGSCFLHNLQANEVLKARLMPNRAFNLPKKAKEVAMIFNGTGIAPFLGMIDENTRQAKIHLYGGFRTENCWIKEYQDFAQRKIQQNRLSDYHFAYSRHTPGQYVMDLIARDATVFAALLKNDGIIMICGSLVMLRDVEKALDQIVQELNDKPLAFYHERKQILHDCY
ncbi:FAD-binding oxidoreductase [Sphingobacterium sp. DK4209]|uniref:FAD-binding oxidoreductase n=1 Tax=Sphingobacterium zhuxiongii TaxID=2662364 RepID=A0A5Q0QGD3_9SPHI|nr:MULTISPECIES: PepSY domain-containing protein [unclassified Sphingobacterium]MVZ64629.1 FAD-binding oxidoreductase [Sphingobacterium sp. DK4209]QGA26968.1 FAD-binding oxidoreductase [Sphingobacterium sp. dk4302]